LAFYGNLYSDYQLRIGVDGALSRRLEPLNRTERGSAGLTGSRGVPVKIDQS